MSNAVVLAGSGEALIEHGSSRRRLLMVGKDLTSVQSEGKRI